MFPSPHEWLSITSAISLIFIILNYIHAYISLYEVCTHVSAGAPGLRKRVLDSQELDLQMVC